MKTLLPLILLTSFNFFYANSQITLEHTYAHGSVIVGEDQLFIVNFEVAGYEYVKVDQDDNSIFIYDLSHNLVKTINLPSGMLNIIDGHDGIIYFSQHLFNSDDKIEFMIAQQTGGNVGVPHWSTYILNEDDSILFFKDNQWPAVFPNYEQQQEPIYNTPNGAKLILSSSQNDSAYVYGLAGTLTAELKLNPNSADGFSTNIFPNPSASELKIDYSLRPGDIPAELKVTNINGQEMASVHVNSLDGAIDLTSYSLPSGIYFYTIYTPTDKIAGKKFIVVK